MTEENYSSNHIIIIQHGIAQLHVDLLGPFMLQITRFSCNMYNILLMRITKIPNWCIFQH